MKELLIATTNPGKLLEYKEIFKEFNLKIKALSLQDAKISQKTEETGQTFEENAAGEFTCTKQEFIAGDQVDYEDQDGKPIIPPEHPYQQFNMTL